MAATAIQIEDLCWSKVRYSDVLKIDRRVVAQALETIPSMDRNGVRVWHVRDGMPAIFRRVWGLDSASDTQNPAKLPPRDRLDHYKAERERIKLAQEVRVLLPAQEVEQVNGEALKALAQGLDVMADTLERDAGLTPEAVMLVQRSIDRQRDQLYDALMNLTVKPQ